MIGSKTDLFGRINTKIVKNKSFFRQLKFIVLFVNKNYVKTFWIYNI